MFRFMQQRGEHELLVDITSLSSGSTDNYLHPTISEQLHSDVTLKINKQNVITINVITRMSQPTITTDYC